MKIGKGFQMSMKGDKESETLKCNNFYFINYLLVILKIFINSFELYGTISPACSETHVLRFV